MKTYHKSIIFTKTPLNGYFRYQDVFQIYPANLEGMPKSKLQLHYPVILEYWTSEAEKGVVPNDFEEIKELYLLTTTTLSKVDKIISLLTVFSNHIFFRYEDSGAWGLPVLKDDAGEEANKWSSKWSMPYFHWPELPKQLEIIEFSDLKGEKIKLVEHFTYYLNTPNFDNYSNTEITFPNTIVLSLNSYFSKSTGTTTVLDSAISFAVSAMELRQDRKSLSILSSFTSVETMVNFENKDLKSDRCDKCSQLQYEVSKKYRDYLFKYIGKTANNKKKFNAYYSLRSKIVHTGQRLKTENLFADVSAEEKKEEYLNHIEILQLGKLAIIHWLLRNKNYLD